MEGWTCLRRCSSTLRPSPSASSTSHGRSGPATRPRRPRLRRLQQPQKPLRPPGWHLRPPQSRRPPRAAFLAAHHPLRSPLTVSDSLQITPLVNRPSFAIFRRLFFHQLELNSQQHVEHARQCRVAQPDRAPERAHRRESRRAQPDHHRTRRARRRCRSGSMIRHSIFSFQFRLAHLSFGSARTLNPVLPRVTGHTPALSYPISLSVYPSF